MNLNKTIKAIVILLIFFIQILFLISILKERINHTLIPYIIILICFALLLVYKYSEIHQKEYSYDKKSILFVIPVSAVLTYLLNNNFQLGSVFSAGIVGTAGSFLYLINKKSDFLKQLAAPIYCGAFIGMTSLSFENVYIMILTAGLISAILYLLTKTLFVGVGGKLGTLAFIGVLISMFIFKFIIK